MNVEDIKSDEIVILTEELYRIFVATGCEPACHACYKDFKVGDKFQLATVNRRQKRGENRVTHDVMLCDKCTVKDLPKEPMSRKEWENIVISDTYRGCFRVDGKIVTTLTYEENVTDEHPDFILQNESRD